MTKNCGSCQRGYMRQCGTVNCGAAVDDDALHGGVEGKNPIWAERKYSKARVAKLLAGDASDPAGSDCENMDPADGADCVMFKAATALQHEEL